MIGWHWAVLQPTAATGDLLIFWLVVAARFLVPLLIPRFPLPAIVAALILDAVDQTIFQTYTSLPLDGYQGYDKALDIYYLTIAYISTMRNWRNEFAFKLSRFLFYYRLVGVVLFELTGFRALLLFFPNVFEYFFIFYEVVRLRWDPVRLSPTILLAAAAGIWAFIKVPQEYWIHVAQLDLTDTIAEFFGAALPGSPLGSVVRFWPLELLALFIVIFAGLLVASRHLPPADRRPRFAADAYKLPFSADQVQHAKSVWSRDVLDRDLAEKAVLVTLISLIFAQILPGIISAPWQLTLAIAVFVVVNTVLSHWLCRRGVSWSSTLAEFGVMLIVNSGLVLGYMLIVAGSHNTVALRNSVFFVVLLTLIITLYDRYRQRYLARFPAAWARPISD